MTILIWHKEIMTILISYSAKRKVGEKRINECRRNNSFSKISI